MDNRSLKPFPILIKNNCGRYTIRFCHPELFLDKSPNENTEARELNFKRRPVNMGNARIKRIQFDNLMHRSRDVIDALCYGYDGYSKLVSDHIDALINEKRKEAEKLMKEEIKFENVVKFESAGAGDSESCILTMKDGSKIKIDRNFWDVFEDMLKDVKKRSEGETNRYKTSTTDTKDYENHCDCVTDTYCQKNEVTTAVENASVDNNGVSNTQKSPEVKKRISKIDYYLDIAEVVASRGTCLRRNYGSVIVKDDRIISTGYTGSPRGRKNCSDIGRCIRQEQNIPRGERYELCRSVHSEMNAIINASKDDMKGATLYLVGREFPGGELVDQPNCCAMCKRAVINAGITRVIVRNSDRSFKIIIVSEWIDDDDSLKMERGY